MQKCVLGWVSSTGLRWAAEHVDYQAVNRNRRVPVPRLPTFSWVVRRSQPTRSQVTRLCHRGHRYIGTTARLGSLQSSLSLFRWLGMISEQAVIAHKPILPVQAGCSKQSVRLWASGEQCHHSLTSLCDRCVLPSDVLDGGTPIRLAVLASPVRERPLFFPTREPPAGPVVFWNPRDPTQGPVWWAHSTSYTMTLANGAFSITLPGSYDPRSDAPAWAGPGPGMGSSSPVPRRYKSQGGVVRRTFPPQCVRPGLLRRCHR